MSTSVHWKPVRPEGEGLCYGCESVRSALEKSFGEMPITLDETSLPILQAMANVYQCGKGDSKNPFAELVEAVTTHGTIEVWDEH